MRGVNWKKQYEIFRSKVTKDTTDDELFEIFCQMLSPLKDGHVELFAKNKGRGQKRYFNPEPKPRFWREFGKAEIKQLFRTTEATLVSEGFGRLKKTNVRILRYCRSSKFGYLRIKELEGVKKPKLATALDKIGQDFESLDGIIVDIRDNPGGDDSVVLAIANRFCDHRQVAFHRKTKIGPGEDDYTPLKTWYIEPEGDAQFTRPVVLLTCDSSFSGAEVFALVLKQLSHVTTVGDRTNGIFSYQLEKKLPNGWPYCLSYQVYYAADMKCYEGKGVPVDVKLLNTKADIENGEDPLIARALEILKSKSRGSAS